MRICCGLGLNFTGMSHQVMSLASTWLSGCFGEGAWWALDLLLMACWFKGMLVLCLSVSPFAHTSLTHTKTPFPFPFSSESTVHVHCCHQWSLCGCLWSWCCSSEGANPVAGWAADHTPLWSLRAVLQRLCLRSGLAGVSWKLKGSALGQGVLSICSCSSKSQRSWWCPDCQRYAWKWWVSGVSKASEIWQIREVAPLLFSWAPLHWTLAPGVDWYNWIILLAKIVQLNASRPVIFYQGPFSSM